MVGGFDIFGSNTLLIKKFELPPHYEITLKITMFKIDSWDNESFFVFVDGVNVISRSFAFDEGS